ncbi:MAG: DinB family protein [Pyrinomonadaceae bacterium]|nr:DinB family protein [Pyrinomonadaceae bacterium]
MNEIISELERISEDVRKNFGGFSAEQINWRVDADSWSVGQCFDHLIKSNELLFDEFDKVARGDRKNSFWENWSPLSSLGGNLLINSLKKDERKIKAPTQKIVPPSEIEAGIIEKFTAHQDELIGKIKKCEKADPQKTIITSPFIKLMTYKFGDGLKIIVEHEKRHFRQAERVTQAENFPK